MGDLFRQPVTSTLKTVNDLFEEVLEGDEEVVVFVFSLKEGQTVMYSHLSLASVLGLITTWVTTRLQELAKAAKPHLDA